MSYAGPVSRPRDPRTTQLSADDSGWQQLATFGAGLALGIAVGAGAALLSAPRSGAETREVIATGVERARRSTVRRSRDAWDELRDEIRQATRTLRRRRARRDLERDADLGI